METNTTHSILELIERETGEKVEESTALENMNIDSLDFLDLIVVIRKEIGFISDVDAGNALTVGDLMRAVKA